MKEPNRERKNDIKYLITLNEEQKVAKGLIHNNQIVIITGRAGSGKSLVGAITALDFLNKKMIDKILFRKTEKYSETLLFRQYQKMKLLFFLF